MAEVKEVKDLKKVDRYIENSKSPQATKATTMILLEKHYNFLRAVQYYETTTLHKSVSMSDIVKDALESYHKVYQEKYNITINERGKVIESK